MGTSLFYCYITKAKVNKGGDDKTSIEISMIYYLHQTCLSLKAL